MAIHIEWIIKCASGCESLIDRKRIKDEHVLLHSTKMDQENVVLVFLSILIDNIFIFLRNTDLEKLMEDITFILGWYETFIT